MIPVVDRTSGARAFVRVNAFTVYAGKTIDVDGHGTSQLGRHEAVLEK